MAAIKPERAFLVAYGLCAVTAATAHLAGFLTRRAYLHTLGWYALGAAIAIGSAPFLAILCLEIGRRLRKRN